MIVDSERLHGNHETIIGRPRAPCKSSDDESDQGVPSRRNSSTALKGDHGTVLVDSEHESSEFEEDVLGDMSGVEVTFTGFQQGSDEDSDDHESSCSSNEEDVGEGGGEGGFMVDDDPGASVSCFT